MRHRQHIAAVSVLYHPTVAVIKNIASFYDQVDQLLLYKNSPLAPALEAEINRLFHEKLVWLGCEENHGIAKALNAGVHYAQTFGFDLLLTMDQDSAFAPDHFAHFAIWARRLSAQYPLLSPNHIILDRPEFRSRDRPMWVMTSGNVIRVSVFSVVGEFNEDFFIDGVDMEWCARLTRHDFKFAICRDIHLQHSLGDTQVRCVANRRIRTTNHSATRLYYIFRNYLAMIRNRELDAPFRRELKKKLLKFLKYVVLFESDKCQKILMIMRGVADQLRGITGPLRR